MSSSLKSIAVTGSDGLLGRYLNEHALAKGIRVHKLKWQDFIDGGSQLSTYLSDLDIEWLIHTAAFTNVDGCEVDTSKSYTSNFTLAANISKACLESQIPLAFISSTGVYGKHKTSPYVETDSTQPSTYHHKHKLLAEKKCLESKSNLIIRTGWLFGDSAQGSRNFVRDRIQELQSNDIVKTNPFQSGNPTYAKDAAERIILLCELNQSGIFNCVNTNFATRHQYIEHISRFYRLQVTLCKLDKPYIRHAKVSDNEMALNERMHFLRLPSMRTWEEALDEYLSTLA